MAIQANMDSSEHILRRAYDAFNARDISAALTLMHPEVDWPNGMEGGRVLGRDAVREYWTRQWKIVDPHVDPVGFSSNAGRTVVDVHQVVRDLDGKVLLDRMVKHLYVIENGLIRSMEIDESGYAK
jgi:hypothetical protein